MQTTFTAEVTSYTLPGLQSSSRPLPPGRLDYETFSSQFNIQTTSTEQPNPVTEDLSRTMHENKVKGLELLLKVDENVGEGYSRFIPIIQSLAPLLAEKLQSEGRVFLIGSGSSGRVGVDIAAKCNLAFPEMEGRIEGIIAGGDSCLILPREKFEDSEKDGEEVLKDKDLGSNDTVILISASGQAPFNVGAGKYAADLGANVYYFYNSETIPKRTSDLFNRETNPVKPLLIDIGGQAISGSTRLQGASLAEICLGGLLGAALYQMCGKEDVAWQYPLDLLDNFQAGLNKIRGHFKDIVSFIEAETFVFSDVNSNFREVVDKRPQGYVTFVATEDSIRDTSNDTAEMRPTYAINAIERERERPGKGAEYRTYLSGVFDNREAWKIMLGRDIQEMDLKEIDQLLIAQKLKEGRYTYENRHLGRGNCLFCVTKIGETLPISEELLDTLFNAQAKGAQVGLIVLCKGTLDISFSAKLPLSLIMENTPSDPFGVTETLILKLILNLISNGAMIEQGKVEGNRMIDVMASNNKLLARVMSIIKDRWSFLTNRSFPLNDSELYYMMIHVLEVMKDRLEEKIYTPSIVKMMLTLIALNKSVDDFQSASDYLIGQNERIDWIK